MAPSAVDQPVNGSADVPMADAKTYPPANIFAVKETRFEKPIEAQPDGRKKALEQPDAAIVIDNGERLPPAVPLLHCSSATNNTHTIR